MKKEYFWIAGADFVKGCSDGGSDSSSDAGGLEGGTSSTAVLEEGGRHPALAPESAVQRQLAALGDAHIGYSGMPGVKLRLKNVLLVLRITDAPALPRCMEGLPFPSWELGHFQREAGGLNGIASMLKAFAEASKGP
eukprot:1145507-Pelagomonas_calceolata.AAC.1